MKTSTDAVRLSMNPETVAVWRNLDLPFFQALAHRLLHTTSDTDILTPRENVLHKVALRLEAEVWEQAGPLPALPRAVFLVCVNLVDFNLIASKLLDTYDSLANRARTS